MLRVLKAVLGGMMRPREPPPVTLVLSNSTGIIFGAGTDPSLLREFELGIGWNLRSDSTTSMAFGHFDLLVASSASTLGYEQPVTNTCSVTDGLEFWPVLSPAGLSGNGLPTLRPQLISGDLSLFDDTFDIKAQAGFFTVAGDDHNHSDERTD